MFRGYLGTETDRLRPDGFYDTGDLVRVDAAGHLFLEGRVSTFINVAGRKVNPRRVERVIEAYPPVREVAVYGVSAGDWGEEVHAAVVLSDGGTVEELVRHCRTRLSTHEVPHHVHHVQRLPRSARGKVERSRLPTGRP
jgi:acyl-CoA synthetase (AMP-forming)/AMP-acid ligase II